MVILATRRPTDHTRESRISNGVIAFGSFQFATLSGLSVQNLTTDAMLKTDTETQYVNFSLAEQRRVEGPVSAV